MLNLDIIAPGARGILRPKPRAVGLGISTDLSTYMADPQFASAWNSVSGQLSGEGASSLDVLAAQHSMVNAFQQMTDNGIDAGSALGAAKSFVVAGHTVYGAVQHVQGLIAAAQGGDPGSTFQTLTGTLIGLAVSAGALSAGLGAAIVGGVGAIIGLVQAAGFFGSPPQGTQICPGLYQNPAPIIQVGCVGTQAPIIAAGAANWRHFPKGHGGFSGDSDWYTYAGSAYWAGSQNGDKHAWASYANYRLIDQAFPDYHYLSCQNTPTNLAQFMAAFSQAWIANKEYALNGLKVQDDWEVLRQVARVWNRAHDGSTYVDVPLGLPKPYVPVPHTCPPPGAFGFSTGPCAPVTGCPQNLPPFFQTINLYNFISPGGANQDILPTLNGLRIHTGALKTPYRPPRTIQLHLGPPPTTAAPSKGPTAGTVVLAGAGAVAAVGIGGTIYALLQKQAVGYFWGKVFDKTIEGGKSLYRRVR